MKIAFFVDRFPLVSETFVLSQIAGMIERGHEVVIFANRQVDTDVRHDGIERYKMMDRLVVRPVVQKNLLPRMAQGVKSFFAAVAAGRLGPALATVNFLRLGRAALGMHLLIRAGAHTSNGCFDILHCQFGQLGIEVAQLRRCRVLSGALVTSFRGTDAMKIASQKPHLFRHLFSAGDRFLAVSGVIKDRLIELGCPGDRIEILRSGVDLSTFGYREPGVFCEPVRLVTIGRLAPNKGIGYALEAVRELLDAGQKVQYRIVGDGPVRQDLIDTVERLEVESSVVFVGAVSSDQVAAILRESDILIAPSITGPQGEQEGLPNSLKEAMACGVLAIGTRIGGIPELIEHGVSGFLVPEKDATAIAECIESILRHQEGVSTIAMRAREKVEQYFDLGRMNEDLESVYRRTSGTYA
jgi:colanic acid/amylovoran biosynthesis glycosyltransferase